MRDADGTRSDSADAAAEAAPATAAERRPPPGPRRALPRPGRGVVFALAVGVLAAAVWTGGLLKFAEMIPERIADATTRTDAIVVLTGGSGRLGAGLDLLTGRKADKLFISGVTQGVEVRKLIESIDPDIGDLEVKVGVGNATNTSENAAETAEWLRREGFKSLRLVTAAYHMPRSLLEFRHAMPEVTLIPHPVFPSHVKRDRWWAWPGTAALIVGEYHKYVVASTRHAHDRFFARPGR
jgi:uncharacterized SAM-binding protein YcdF (DUF218 family)